MTDNGPGLGELLSEAAVVDIFGIGRTSQEIAVSKANQLKLKCPADVCGALVVGGQVVCEKQSTGCLLANFSQPEIA